MEARARLQNKIASIEDLQEIIGATRSLAAVRVQQGHDALEGVRRYTGIVGKAIAGGVSLFGPAGTASAAKLRGSRSVVVFCSEHGLVGAFNERLIEHAAGAAGPAVHLCVVGARGALLAQERGLAVAWTVPMATHVSGILETARRVATELYRRIDQGAYGGVDVVYARYRSGAQWSIQKEVLFPLDFTPFAKGTNESPPLHNLPPRLLIEKLVAEFVLAELTRAAAESFASENSARLQLMESAHDNIQDKLDDLKQRERQLRQEETTTELLDVVTGSEALRGRA